MAVGKREATSSRAAAKTSLSTLSTSLSGGGGTGQLCHGQRVPDSASLGSPVVPKCPTLPGERGHPWIRSVSTHGLRGCLCSSSITVGASRQVSLAARRSSRLAMEEIQLRCLHSGRGLLETDRIIPKANDWRSRTGGSFDVPPEYGQHTCLHGPDNREIEPVEDETSKPSRTDGLVAADDQTCPPAGQFVQQETPEPLQVSRWPRCLGI